MKNKEVNEAFKRIFEIAEDLGFKVFFSDEKDILDGLIIGTEDFFEAVRDGEEDLDEYNMVTGMSEDSPEDGGLH